jgi:hypothetical protein
VASNSDYVAGAQEGTLRDIRDFIGALENYALMSSDEFRYDIPLNLVLGDIYIGTAPDSTPTASTAWTVTRIYFDANGHPNRKRRRTGVAWDNKAAGW